MSSKSGDVCLVSFSKCYCYQITASFKRYYQCYLDALMLCPLCTQDMEPLQHLLLLLCNFAWNIWCEIMAWWKRSWVWSPDFGSLPKFWFFNEVSKLEKIIWKACRYAVPWSLSKMRMRLFLKMQSLIKKRLLCLEDQNKTPTHTHESQYERKFHLFTQPKQITKNSPVLSFTASPHLAHTHLAALTHCFSATLTN